MEKSQSPNFVNHSYDCNHCSYHYLLFSFLFLLFTLFHIQPVFISTVNAVTYKFNSDISKEFLKLSTLHEQYTVAT